MLLKILVISLISLQAPAKEEGPDLTWKEVPGAIGYQVQISSGSDFKDLLLEKRVIETKFKWVAEKPGNYHWRVWAVNADGQLGSPSDAGLVSVFVSPPKIENKAQTLNIISDKKFELHWAPSPRGKVYQVDISDDPSFVSARTFTSDGLHLSEKVTNDGVLYWRVRAMDGKENIISRYSETGQIIIEKTPHQILAQKVEATDSTHLSIYDRWVWAGSGMVRMNYSQNLTSSDTRISFTDAGSPIYFVDAGGWLKNGWGIEGSYKNVPGQVKSSSSITVNNGKFSWQTISLEGFKPISQGSRFHVRIGVQEHFVPFMNVTPTGGVDVKNNAMTAASFGFSYQKPLGRRIQLEGLGRYQYPVTTVASSGDTMQIQSPMIFDGLVGSSYYFNSSWKAGLFLHGQYHSYSFKYTSGSTGNANVGTQTFFYNDIELRAGFEF